ncbi:MAG: TolC family protein [Planctomycetaceae bacterium]
MLVSMAVEVLAVVWAALAAGQEPLPDPASAARRAFTADIEPPDVSGVVSVPGAVMDERTEPLLLSEVLQSVLMHFPLLHAIERERGIAAGRYTTAQGAFDTNVAMAGNALAPGTYENYRSDLGLTQQFMFGGISAFGGYRTGFGDYPTYNLAQKTADAGEVRGGLNVPFARNRDIDRARATHAQAQVDMALAEPTIERSRLDYLRSAARAYWAWQGSGERYGAGERILKLAIDRDEQLELKVNAGAVANIERVDNQQNIALRNGIVVQADRAVQQSTIELSLYHRDQGGRPLLARRRRMQPVPQPVRPTVALYEESLARAFGARPEFQRLALQKEKLAIERRLAANQTLPGVDGQLLGNQDAGYGKSPLSGPNGLDRQVLQASLVFQMPAQRRDARGKLQTIDSQLMQLDRQLAYAGDQVRAEVQDAYSMLERAYEFHKQAAKRLELARLVADAEREQLRLGRSDVLRVTLREQAKFEADVLEITARQEFWRAESDLRAADTSIGPDSPGLLRQLVVPVVPETIAAPPPGAAAPAPAPPALAPPALAPPALAPPAAPAMVPLPAVPAQPMPPGEVTLPR